MLQPLSRLQRLSIRISDAGLIVDPRTEIGNSSNAVFYRQPLDLYLRRGRNHRSADLGRIDENQLINNIFLMPLSKSTLA